MSTEIVKREPHTPERVSERPFEVPCLDVFENADELLLLVDLPGVTRAGLDLGFHEGVLSIEGRRGAPREGATVLRAERRSVDLVRQLSLPEGLDVGRSEATLVDGVLRLRLPKAATRKPRKIDVQVV